MKTLAAVLVGLLFVSCLSLVLAQRSGVFSRHNPGRAASLADAVQSPTDAVQYRDARVAFIIGPQLRAGSALNPFPWFDSVQLSKGIDHGEAFPAISPMELTGTVSVSQGSRTVTGSGTRFTREVDAQNVSEWFNGRLRILDTDGQTYRAVRVASVDSDTQLTLTSVWNSTGLVNRPADTFYRNEQQNGWNYDRYLDSAYYDLALVEYINYYRTGDERYRVLARKVADSWFAGLHIRSGTVTGGPRGLNPRSMAAAGLMLRALDGRPEMWDWINRYARAQFDNWIMLRINDSSLYYDLRDDGYAQLYAVMLARVLPNSYPLYANGTDRPPTGTATNGAALRASYLADAERAAVQFFGRLQYPNGSWRWNVEGENLVGIEQPFMVGLYLEAAVLLHQSTTRPDVRRNLETQITRACRHLYTEAYRNEAVQDLPSKRWRGLWYFYHGGTRTNPTEFERGGGNAARLDGNAGYIQEQRHLNSTVHHAFGYAYLITGEERYRQWGDDIFDASFGGSDGIRGLADENRAKNYVMNFRASGRYLVWRLAGAGAQNPSAMVSPMIQPPVTSTPQLAELTSNGLASPGMISTTLATATRLAASSIINQEEVSSLITQIESANQRFMEEKNQFVSSEVVLEELQAALNHARIALVAAQAGGGESNSTAKLRVEWAATRLHRANNRLRSSTTPIVR